MNIDKYSIKSNEDAVACDFEDWHDYTCEQDGYEVRVDHIGWKTQFSFGHEGRISAKHVEYYVASGYWRRRS